ncbi:hypothetical protein ADL27_46475, partial [Streptomyces sp. NRRL F-6602]
GFGGAAGEIGALHLLGRGETPETLLSTNGEPLHPLDEQAVAAVFADARDGDARTGGRLGMRSRLGELVTRIAGREGRTRGAVSTEWFARYLKRVVAPVLWLDGHARHRLAGGPPPVKPPR